MSATTETGTFGRDDDRAPITELLSLVRDGDSAATERLWQAVYADLRGMAQAQAATERATGALQPTALVHEAYLRLFGNEGAGFENRAHFYGAAANAMRRIRVDDARMRKRAKRGGGLRPVSLDQLAPSQEHPAEPALDSADHAETLLAVDALLGRFRAEAGRAHDVVVMRFFAGLTVDQTAEALGVSPRTVDSDWHYARAWLRRELSSPDKGD